MHRLEGHGTLKAFVDIIVENALIIKGIRLVKGKHGLFISMPSEQGKDTKWYESVRVTDSYVRKDIAMEIIEEYHNINERSKYNEPSNN